MSAVFLVHRFCTVPISLVFLGFALLVNLVARNRETSLELWAVIKEALRTIIQKGDSQ